MLRLRRRGSKFGTRHECAGSRMDSGFLMEAIGPLGPCPFGLQDILTVGSISLNIEMVVHISINKHVKSYYIVTYHTVSYHHIRYRTISYYIKCDRPIHENAE